MTVDERLREMLADNGLNKEEVDAIVGALDDRKHERNQDVAVADEAYEEYVKSGKKSRPIEEFWDELGI